MTPEQLTVYAAGLFDGEGCIYIGRIQRAGRRLLCFRMIAKIAMTTIEPLKVLHGQWGGHLGLDRHTTHPRDKDIYNWILAPKQAAVFLKDVLPFLIIKRERAEIALKFQEHMSTAGQYRVGMNLKKFKGQEITPPVVLDLRESYYLQMRALNKRGVNVQ